MKKEIILCDWCFKPELNKKELRVLGLIKKEKDENEEENYFDVERFNECRYCGKISCKECENVRQYKTENIFVFLCKNCIKNLIMENHDCEKFRSQGAYKDMTNWCGVCNKKLKEYEYKKEKNIK